MKKIIIIFILFTSFVYSQNVMTKFSLKGYLINKPSPISDQLCKFKKNDNVFLIEQIDGRWWKVNFDGCIGYVTSPYLVLTDDLIEKANSIENNYPVSDNDAILSQPVISKGNNKKASKILKRAYPNSFKKVIRIDFINREKDYEDHRREYNRNRYYTSSYWSSNKIKTCLVTYEDIYGNIKIAEMDKKIRFIINQ